MVDGQKSIFFLLFLVLSTVLLSTPRITIQVNQPGNLILTAEIDSVWVGNDYRIHTSPKLKSWIRPDYVTLPYFSETLVGVPSTAQIIWFPGEERHISISNQLKFQWIDDQNTSQISSYYLIKIENEWGQGLWSCLFLNPNFLNNGELVSYEYSINGLGCIDHQGINELLNPGKYYWKIKALHLGNGINSSNDHDVAGAESNWVEINIVESGKIQ